MAEPANRLGVIKYVAPVEELEEFIVSLTGTIRENAPLSIAVMKEQCASWSAPFAAVELPRPIAGSNAPPEAFWAVSWPLPAALEKEHRTAARHCLENQAAEGIRSRLRGKLGNWGKSKSGSCLLRNRQGSPTTR